MALTEDDTYHDAYKEKLKCGMEPIHASEFFYKMPFISIKLLTIDLELRILQNTCRRVISNTWNNIFPLNIFQTMLLPE